MNSTQIHRFENSLELFKRTRIRKLAKAPRKLVFSKALEIASRLRRGGITTRARLFFGDEMVTVFPEEVSVALWLYGFYEEGVTRMLLEHLKPGMTFFDVGAHFGYYTLLASRIVGDKGQVHAFEPTPSTFQILQSNTRHRHNVHVNRAALTSKCETVPLNDYGLRFAGRNSLYRVRSDHGSMKGIRPRKYEVQTWALDDYILDNNLTPDFVKIDAENAEHEILLGLDKTLSQTRPVLSVEVGDAGIDEIPTSRELIAYVSRKGYQAYEFSEGGFSQHQIRDRYDWDNILFLPG